jgi:hypothetical protein
MSYSQFRKLSVVTTICAFIGVIALLGTESAYASNSSRPAAITADPAYLTIGSVELQEVDIATLSPIALESGDGSIGQDLDETQVVLDQFINMGKKIWSIIEANRPVVNVKTDIAHALPLGVQSWQQLATWQTPQAKAFRVVYKNLYGASVVDFTFRLHFTHGGSVNGKGAYLTHITVVPANLSVVWGYTFNAQTEIPSITNAGTHEAPVAGALIEIKWSVDTALKHQQNTASYYVRGDGQFNNLATGTLRLQ